MRRMVGAPMGNALAHYNSAATGAALFMIKLPAALDRSTRHCNRHTELRNVRRFMSVRNWELRR
jgi:hypothetical protein